jgi:hypothetical protein
MTGKGEVKEAGGSWVDTGDGNAVALTRGGVLLAGTNTLVKERVAGTWQKPALTAGNLAGVAEVINQKPVFALFVSMSQTARTEALAGFQGQNFVTDVIKRHKMASFAVFSDGIGWSWVDSNKTGLDAMEQIAQGTVEVLRASQIAPRGFAKIVMGALESYRGTNKQVDEALKRKADIQKLIESFSGDGNFKAQIDKNPTALSLKVRLSGKSLSEVLPAGGFIPLGIIGWLTTARGSDAPPPQIAVPPPPSSPAKKATPTPAPSKGGPPKRP